MDSHGIEKTVSIVKMDGALDQFQLSYLLGSVLILHIDSISDLRMIIDLNVKVNKDHYNLSLPYSDLPRITLVTNCEETEGIEQWLGGHFSNIEFVESPEDIDLSSNALNVKRVAETYITGTVLSSMI